MRPPAAAAHNARRFSLRNNTYLSGINSFFSFPTIWSIIRFSRHFYTYISTVIDYSQQYYVNWSVIVGWWGKIKCLKYRCNYEEILTSRSICPKRDDVCTGYSRCCSRFRQSIMYDPSKVIHLCIRSLSRVDEGDICRTAAISHISRLASQKPVDDFFFAPRRPGWSALGHTLYVYI